MYWPQIRYNYIIYKYYNEHFVNINSALFFGSVFKTAVLL